MHAMHAINDDVLMSLEREREQESCIFDQNDSNINITSTAAIVTLLSCYHLDQHPYESLILHLCLIPFCRQIFENTRKEMILVRVLIENMDTGFMEGLS